MLTTWTGKRRSMTNMNTSCQWCSCKICNSFRSFQIVSIVFRWHQCRSLQNCSHSITKHTFVVQSHGTVSGHPRMSLEAAMSYAMCSAHTATCLLHQPLHCSIPSLLPGCHFSAISPSCFPPSEDAGWATQPWAWNESSSAGTQFQYTTSLSSPRPRPAPSRRGLSRRVVPVTHFVAVPEALPDRAAPGEPGG